MRKGERWEGGDDDEGIDQSSDKQLCPCAFFVFCFLFLEGDRNVARVPSESTQL